MMGGRIWVESEAGVGSTFHFTSSFAAGDGRRDRGNVQAPVQLAGLKVMVVDDNATNRRFLERTLVGWKMNPVLASSGEEAVERGRALPGSGGGLDLILLDYHMPGMDGFEVAERISSLPGAGDTPVMMLSSGENPGDMARSRELGIRVFLRKPVTQADLYDNIVETLTAARGQAAANAPKQLPRNVAFARRRVGSVRRRESVSRPRG